MKGYGEYCMKEQREGRDEGNGGTGTHRGGDGQRLQDTAHGSLGLMDTIQSIQSCRFISFHEASYQQSPGIELGWDWGDHRGFG